MARAELFIRQLDGFFSQTIFHLPFLVLRLELKEHSLLLSQSQLMLCCRGRDEQITSLWQKKERTGVWKFSVQQKIQRSASTVPNCLSVQSQLHSNPFALLSHSELIKGCNYQPNLQILEIFYLLDFRRRLSLCFFIINKSLSTACVVPLLL